MRKEGRYTIELSKLHSLYSLIYLDLTSQTEKVTRDLKQLIFRYKLSAAPAAPFSVHAIVLYEEMVGIDKFVVTYPLFSI